MQLVYHKGDNFGDALNPLLFQKLFPDLLKRDDNLQLLGVGSLLGLIKPDQNAEKMIVFSTGFGGGDKATYGALPQNLEKYCFICVRGPNTAKALGLDESVAISDGALLTPLLLDLPQVDKVYEYAFMPHVGTLDMSNEWKELMEEENIHFIDPRKAPLIVLEEILKTKVLLTEAMHGAILADALRTPWVAVKTNKNINQFKWEDYLATVQLKYQPFLLPTLYDRAMLINIFKRKVKMTLLAKLMASIYLVKQKQTKQKVTNMIHDLKLCQTLLCREEVLQEKQQQLLKAANQLKNEYPFAD